MNEKLIILDGEFKMSFSTQLGSIYFREIKALIVIFWYFPPLLFFEISTLNEKKSFYGNILNAADVVGKEGCWAFMKKKHENSNENSTLKCFANQCWTPMSHLRCAV